MVLWQSRGSRVIGTVAAILGALASAGLASDFSSTTWRTEDGLPHSAVNSIVQTRDGYLWIGTYVGVVRFDGVKFVHFSTANLPQLGPGRVSKLFEDRNGVLWIGLETGRLLALKDGEARIHLPNSTTPNDAVVAMVQDRAGTIWLQTALGHFGQLTSDSVEFVADTGPLSQRSNLGLVVDEADALWVGTRDGLRIWEHHQLVAPPEMTALGSRPIEAFTRARDGGLWIFRDRQLRKVRDSKTLLEVEAPPSFEGVAVELLEAADGRLWLAAGDGGLFCLEKSGSWQAITAEFGLHGGHKTLCEDREGNLWRGSFGGGLTRLRPKLFTRYELPESDLDRYAASLCPDAAGGVWMLLNAHSLGRVEAGSDPAGLRLWQPPQVPQNMRTIYSDRRGSLWLGWGDGRLGRWKAGDFVAELKVSPQADFVSAIFEDAQSNLWVGFSQGAGVGFMPQGDPARWQAVKGMPYPDVRAITQAADGAMWFGTHYGGVFRLKDERWTRFTTRDGLPSDYVRFLHAEPDGTIWLGTLNGLCRWRNGTFTPIKTENGLWHNSLSAIAEDSRGNFWMSSFGGVFRASRQELNDFADGRRTSVQCIGYNRNDGLHALECPGGFQPAVAKTRDGRLWFPTVDGIVSVDPEHTTENKLPPPVVVEEITVDGNASAVRADTALEIPAGKHRIEFRFTGLSFTAPEKVRFRHKLDGLDTDWSLADDRRAVTYSFVPPGHYSFRVTACNNDGVWSPDGASLGIVVRPFLWQRWWFRAGAGFALAVALVWAVRERERRKSRVRLERLERQHALERERARIAQDIHDEVGASLTQIAFLSERVRLAGPDAAEAEHWNQRVGHAARRTIQSLDEIVWAVSPKHDTLESLANYLVRFAQDHLSLAGIRCVLDVATVLPPIAVSAELRHNLLLAAREALQNTVAHADATEVRVGLELREDVLEIYIADNGRGFDPERVSGDGNGRANMRKRLEEIGGLLEITSQPGSGTTVRFTVPRKLLGLHVSGIGETEGAA